MLTPNLAPTPVLIGTTITPSELNAVKPKPPTKYAEPSTPPNSAENGVDRRQIVDQHHGSIAVGAGVEAERRPLPEDGFVPGVAGVHFAFAVTQTADEGGRRFLAENVSVGQAPPSPGFLDGFGEAARQGAEKAMAAVDDFVDREWRRRIRPRGPGDGEGP